ncbi:M20/M25/M40 family metallo-hydrolase [Erythrobacter sp. F6033]|uniref:M20/M25/M40 family metallo-hydrolase n=1 Tax=Erythrobacter sp. F6033 TaxID=2926401 RepID=UPI001FF59266|nr:M20/M25/M40 family metallo-hydrolase [Erythrobacter sp. F6033]MCK0128440.1 M20/M25/M40 family metallo-hydrolase [Erythrobacter sp. F6033]
MKSLRFAFACSALAIAAVPVAVSADEAGPNAQIIDEGLNRSQIQQMAHELVDDIGPRLTNSSNMRKAEAWAVAKMEELGLENVRKEGFEFGRGWEVVSSHVEMMGPRPLELTAIPVAWTPGTEGPVEGEVIVAPISSPAQFEAYRGMLEGKIVLISRPGTGDEPSQVPFRRLDDEDISSRDLIAIPEHNPDGPGGFARFVNSIKTFPKQLDEFLASEGAIAWGKISYRDAKLLHGTGYNHEVGNTQTLPGLEIAAEDYRRLARLAIGGEAPRMRIDTRVRFIDDDTQSYNIIGEIRGTDPKAGYVMAGAHIDSWHGADGAVDNAAGVVTALEAARIIKSLGKRPKRSIRIALWGAEEQGLYGSAAYVRRHIVSRAGEEGMTNAEILANWTTLYPITPKPGFYDMKAYFNMDNGSGKFRGIHAEENIGAIPMLEKWMKPFNGLGAKHVVAGATGGTDHIMFQAVGLPGFQFIQDPLDYGSRLHHTNADTFDHLRPDDLRQASVVMAGMLLAAANDEKTLPREPLPQRPTNTNPFGQ